MVNIVRSRQNSLGGSPRSAEVGEIDTKAPFQSVRAAVSLFGETSSPKTKPIFIKKSKSQTEGVLDKEAQFHLCLNELNKLKEQLRGVKSTKTETLAELKKAKRTVDELKAKLKAVNESRKSIAEGTEILIKKAKELQEAKSNNKSDIHVDSPPLIDSDTQNEYTNAIEELDAGKKQLNNRRQEFNVALEAKCAAFRNSEEALLAADAHRDKVTQLSNQIGAMQEVVAQMKASSQQAVEDHRRLVGQKEAEVQSRRLAKQDTEDRLISLKNDHQPLLSDDVDLKLSETNVEIGRLQEQVQNTRIAFLEAQTRANLELEAAKKTLEQVDGEKISLQTTVEFLKEALERVSKELSQQKSKEEQAGSLVHRLQAELERKKKELEIVSSLERLALETEMSLKEAQDMKRKTEDWKQQTKIAKNVKIEKENELARLLKEIEEAKPTTQPEEIGVMFEKANTESNNASKIKLSKEEYSSLIERANESEDSVQHKVVATMAQVEALVESQKEAAKKIEMGLKEIEELKTVEDEALKSAEMAKAEANVLDNELQKRHHQGEVKQSSY